MVRDGSYRRWRDGVTWPLELEIVEEGATRALLLDGVVVSVSLDDDGQAPGHWAGMLPVHECRRALILGLGGGTIAHLLARRWPGVEIVGVDLDARLIDFALLRFGLALPNLRIIIGDAFSYIALAAGTFDYIAVDLFVGTRLQRGAMAKPFLRHLERLVAVGGEIAFNLVEDRRTARHVARLSKLLRVLSVGRYGKNWVVLCGRRGGASGLKR